MGSFGKRNSTIINIINYTRDSPALSQCPPEWLSFSQQTVWLVILGQVLEKVLITNHINNSSTLFKCNSETICILTLNRIDLIIYTWPRPAVTCQDVFCATICCHAFVLLCQGFVCLTADHHTREVDLLWMEICIQKASYRLVSSYTWRAFTEKLICSWAVWKALFTAQFVIYLCHHITHNANLAASLQTKSIAWGGS